LRRRSFESLNSRKQVISGGFFYRKNMTSVLNKEATITKLVASVVEAPLVVGGAPELVFVPDVLVLGAPVPPARVES